VLTQRTGEFGHVVNLGQLRRRGSAAGQRSFRRSFTSKVKIEGIFVLEWKAKQLAVFPKPDVGPVKGHCRPKDRFETRLRQYDAGDNTQSILGQKMSLHRR